MGCCDCCIDRCCQADANPTPALRPCTSKATTGVPVAQAGELHLATTCAEEVEATLTETDEEVQIGDIKGRALGDGRDSPDCHGVVSFTLSDPIGDRGRRGRRQDVAIAARQRLP